jgi:hypothetical protein
MIFEADGLLAQLLLERVDGSTADREDAIPPARCGGAVSN